MKRVFSWDNFSREFLYSIITSPVTSPRLRSIDPNKSVMLMAARVQRIAQKPSANFVCNYRREIENNFIFADEKRLVDCCDFLKNKNIDGIDVTDDVSMMRSLSVMKLTNALTAVYIDELNKVGLDTDDSKERIYYSEPIVHDLSCVVPNDIALEDYQRNAVENLSQFYELNGKGILVMPTGSGKTRIAVYYLLRNMVSRGYQVIWLAHRHMLLEQTADTFRKNASLIKLTDNKREQMKMICISGEHCHINRADKECDIIIGSVQSLYGKLDVFDFFLRKKVMIVVDEAHHTTAPTYRRIIAHILSIRPDSKLLGLTATPARMNERDTATLMKLYDDNIVYSISLGELSTKQVLADPVWESISTNFEIETHIDVDEKAYIAKWGELSPDMIDFLAKVCERNELIVNTYLKKREFYGKTIVFAMNAHHCMSLCDLFVENGVKCDYVYSGEADNEEKINRFRRGELDVLININILTEGSDIPDIQTVFITRPTQSDVLLMQMVGRGLRGKAFDGTETVNIVDFCDKWENFKDWLNPKQVFGELLPFSESEYKTYHAKRCPWQMFKDIIKGISYTYGERGADSVVSIPVGWYYAYNGSHRTSVIVFEDQLGSYEKIMSDYSTFLSGKYKSSAVIEKYFRTFCLMPSENDISLVIDEIIRTEAPLTFYRFDERQFIDASIIGRELHKNCSIPPVIEKRITEAYEQYQEKINMIYGGFDEFRKEIYRCIISGENSIVGVPVPELEKEMLPYNREPVYDLDELCTEVINEMFKRKYRNRFRRIKTDRPKILWTEKYMGAYFGAYYPEQNMILVNSVLNSPDVDRETVKFIIYHELLHTEIFRHTKEFYELEHKYPDFARHNHFLDDTFRKFDLSMESEDVK